MAGPQISIDVAVPPFAFFLIFLAAGFVVADDHIDHQPGESLTAWHNDSTLYSYQLANDGAPPYFHPIANTNGDVLTELSPPGHVWHRGVWFSWKNLNGVNYWEWADRSSPPPDGQTNVVGNEVVEQTDSGVSIAMELHYTHGNELVLHEDREITIESPRADGSYAMDWRMTFTAPSDSDQPVQIDRTPPPSEGGPSFGGYAGLSYRGNLDIQDFHYLNSEGQIDQAAHGQSARWMNFSGTLGDNQVGVAMFDHPDNLPDPTPWYILSGERAYFSPALLFDDPILLLPGEFFELRYRMLIYSGQLDSLALEEEFNAFAAPEPAPFSANFDNDADVDGDDLLQWEGDFGLNGDSDADDDNDSDGADFLSWQRQFGSGLTNLAVPTTVPEPSTVFFVAIATGSLLMSRRTRQSLIR